MDLKCIMEGSVVLIILLGLPLPFLLRGRCLPIRSPPRRCRSRGFLLRRSSARPIHRMLTISPQLRLLLLAVSPTFILPLAQPL